MVEFEKGTNEDRDLWEAFKRASAPRRSPCPSLLEIAAYVEGGLGRKQTEVFEEHLAACSTCLDAVRELRLMLDAPLAEVPEDVRKRVKSILAHRPKTHRFVIPVLLGLSPVRAAAWAAAAVFVAAAGATGYFLGQGLPAGHNSGIGSSYFAPALAPNGSANQSGPGGDGRLLTGGAF